MKAKRPVTCRPQYPDCPDFGGPWTRPSSGCICREPIWIVIQPGQHIHIQCPVHGNVKINGPSISFMDQEVITHHVV